MIERHKAQLGQNASAKGRSKTFEKEDEEQRLRDMGFSEQQIMMLVMFDNVVNTC